MFNWRRVDGRARCEHATLCQNHGSRVVERFTDQRPARSTNARCEQATVIRRSRTVGGGLRGAV